MFDEALDYVLKCLQPGTVLVSMVKNEPAYSHHFPDGRIVDEIYIGRTGSSPEPHELEGLQRTRDEMRKACEAEGPLKVALAKLQSANVHYEIGGQGDACGEFAVLRLRMHKRDLDRLEDLAAQEAGIVCRSAKEEAAERFRIFMLRNYSPDYLENRERYPDVGGSPYSPPGTWSDT